MLALAVCFADCTASAITPFKTLDLSPLAPKATWCDGSWVLFPNTAIWVDNKNLVVWLIASCTTQDRQKSKSLSELVFVTTDGKAKVLQSTDTVRLARGPAGAVLVGRGVTVDLMRPNLKVEQSLACPANKVCAVFPSPTGSAKSDFALCSILGTTEHCDFYQGLPAQLSGPGADLAIQGSGTPKDPYPNVAATYGISTSPYSRMAWRVDDDHVWYFDKHGVLTSSKVGRSPEPVSSERWTPNDGNCSGEVSAIEPRRFLAICVGAHFYTDGDLDAIFGYSRIALFDVDSKQIVARIDGPAYTSATLSPDGRQIAVIHRERVKIRLRLYTTD